MNRLTREADELIRKVVARYNNLYSASGTVSQLELDLMLDDLRQMYDKFKTISLYNLQHQHLELPKSPKISTTETQAAASITEEPIQPDPVQEDKTQASPEADLKPEVMPGPVTGAAEENFQAEPDMPGEIVVQSLTENKQADEEAEEIASTVVQHPTLEKDENSMREHIQNSQTLADRFRKDQKSLSDVISSATTTESSLGARLGHATVTDLKSVIGLAEKFAFINELFNGDALSYEKAIVQLNGCSHLTEAETYLATLRLNSGWPADSPLVHLLYDIVRRRFNA